MAEQLPLPLPARSALGREDYFVSPANAIAVAMVEGWRDWPQRKLVLLGPSLADGPPGPGHTRLLFDLAADPGERVDLALFAHPAIDGGAAHAGLFGQPPGLLVDLFGQLARGRYDEGPHPAPWALEQPL